ncbi:DNA replication/repair protein RecF [Halieaceae bacterium]|nr:DNA replication/repair protein RecF [Halieaceae bacterium]
MLRRLDIHHIRNIRGVRLDGLSRVNVFAGPNGSGKTSVLEAIHILGMARSFRSASIKSLISHGQADCTVHGALRLDNGGREVPVGVRRGNAGEAEIRVAGETVRTVAVLAAYLPLQVINADSFDLLTGPPQARRQYLDWGVFHVEQRFLGQWQRFQRCIKQRNNLLRRDNMAAPEIEAWTRDLVDAGNAINTFRKDYFAALSPRFEAIVQALSPELGALQLSYRQGWDRNTDYAEALTNSLEADMAQGYTHVGPQRADIRVSVDGHLAADTLSRGQQKLVVCALKLAQGQLISEGGARGCAYLVDDLPSELDEQHCRLICESLDALGAQIFITCVDDRDIRKLWPAGADINVFHVERGAISLAQ